MNKTRMQFAFPVYIVIFGVSWLLNVLNVIPEINWFRTLSVGAVGVLILIIWDFNRLTFIIGTSVIIESICSFLIQIGKLKASSEVPILIIVIGCLLLLSQFLKIPSSNILKHINKREIDE